MKSWCFWMRLFSRENLNINTSIYLCLVFRIKTEKHILFFNVILFLVPPALYSEVPLGGRLPPYADHCGSVWTDPHLSLDPAPRCPLAPGPGWAWSLPWRSWRCCRSLEDGWRVRPVTPWPGSLAASSPPATNRPSW